VPLAFAFTAATDGTAEKGAKDRMLQDVLQWVTGHCPNVEFTLSDKDVSEISAFRIIIPKAKHQLCYWHAVKYIEERLAEDKPPAYYDPRKVHTIFAFVDPTWAPGVTDGWLEDGVHENDVENPDITTEQASSETKVRELADHLRNTTYMLTRSDSLSCQ
jgi:hypothetical protein